MNCEQLWLATRYVLVLLLWTGVPAAAMAQHRLAGPGETGASLPILPPKQPPITEPDWRKVPQPKPFIVRPPKGAPNVVIVLLDQTAYADPSTFGGPISFPTLDRLAREGLTYTNFHVNSLCSPSRTALLTGRNQHQNSRQPWLMVQPRIPAIRECGRRSVATIAEILRNWGYTHGDVRQEPRDTALGSQCQRTVRPLARSTGIREILRLHRRREIAVPARTSSMVRPSSACRAIRTITSASTSRTRRWRGYARRGP